MSNSPLLSDIPRAAFPDDDQSWVVDAIGPLKLGDAWRPHIMATLTALSPTDQGWSRHGNPRIIDLHVADLIDVSPSQFVKARKVSRPPKGFLSRLITELNMQTATTHLLKEFPTLFTANGFYPRGTKSFIGQLRCLAFPTAEMTVIIPCLDIWRFIIGQSTGLLTLSTQAECLERMETMRQNSVIKTPSGESYALPLTQADTVSRRELLKSATLSLHLDQPDDFNLAELPFLAWCMTDENVFNAMTRFYGSIVAAEHRSASNIISAPHFGFPIDGTFKVRLAGHPFQMEGQPYFLVQRIHSFQADIPMPKVVMHPLGIENNDFDPSDDSIKVKYLHGKPKLHPDAEIDSLKPAHPTHKVLQLDSQSHPLPHLRGVSLRSRNRGKAVAVTTLSTGKGLEEREITLSAETSTEGKRGAKASQGLETIPDLPPEPQPPIGGQERPFCDLEGVVERLRKHNITAEVWTISANSDVTTLFPRNSGTWATRDGKRRSALIFKLHSGTQEAVLLEWERLGKSETGKLLLCRSSSITSSISEAQIKVLLRECALKRGVWPTQYPGLQLVPLVHRQPHAEKMSAVVLSLLKQWAWGNKQHSSEIER